MFKNNEAEKEKSIMVGSWIINVTKTGMPQKVATAIGELSEKLTGAEYTPIAYLGSQLANGINHAVLAEQLVITGRDTKNVVLLIFNEKDMQCNLVNIERVIEGGEAPGGITLNVTTDIPEDARKAFDAALSGFVGSGVKPFALLGTQVTKGTEYIFAAEVVPVTAEPETKAALVVVNSLTNSVKFVDLLSTPVTALGYAFTWL